MEVLVATIAESLDKLKTAASQLDTYNADATWLVVGEESAAKRAFLKSFSLKRGKSSYFIPLHVVRKISPVVFEGAGGAFNAALLCGAVTNTPVMILHEAVSESRELARLEATEADAVLGCSTGKGRNPEFWIKEIEQALQAYEQKIVGRAFCIKKIREALSGESVKEEPATCADAIYVQPKAAKRICFPPASVEPIVPWARAAEHFGLRIAKPKRPWAKCVFETSLNRLEEEWTKKTKTILFEEIVEYVLRKASFRIYSDYFLDEACAAVLAKAPASPTFSKETLEKIRNLKDAELETVFTALTKPPTLPSLEELQTEGRAFFTSFKQWEKIIEQTREKNLISFNT